MIAKKMKNKKIKKYNNYIDIIFFMNTEIPFIAYIYLGITSVVLAYVTYFDESQSEKTEDTNSTQTLLPSFIEPSSENNTNSNSNESKSILPSFLSPNTNEEKRKQKQIIKRKITNRKKIKTKNNKSKIQILITFLHIFEKIN